MIAHSLVRSSSIHSCSHSPLHGVAKAPHLYARLSQYLPHLRLPVRISVSPRVRRSLITPTPPSSNSYRPVSSALRIVVLASSSLLFLTDALSHLSSLRSPPDACRCCPMSMSCNVFMVCCCCTSHQTKQSKLIHHWFHCFPPLSTTRSVETPSVCPGWSAELHNTFCFFLFRSFFPSALGSLCCFCLVSVSCLLLRLTVRCRLSLLRVLVCPGGSR